MADKITFSKTLNTSIQKGDELWYSNIINGVPTSPISSGTISDKGDNWVEVANAPATAGSGDFITNGGFNPSFDISIIANGDFTTDASGWNNGVPGNPLPTGITWNNGEVDFNLTQGWTKLNQHITSFMANAVMGDQYLIKFDITNYSQGQLIGRLSGPTSNEGSVIFPTDATTSSHAVINGVGSYEYLVTLGGSSFGHEDRFYLGLDNTPGGFVGSVDNISVQKQLPPTEWTGTNVTFVTKEALIQIPAGGDFSYVEQSISYIPGETYKVTFDAKGSVGNRNIRVQDHNSDLGGLIQADTTMDVTDSWATYDFTWVANASSNNIAFARNNPAQTSWNLQIDNVSIIHPSTAEELFFMFRKPVEQNISSLKGYFAEATFTNSSTAKQELFAVGSEVTMSSE